MENLKQALEQLKSAQKLIVKEWEKTLPSANNNNVTQKEMEKRAVLSDVIDGVSSAVGTLSDFVSEN